MKFHLTTVCLLAFFSVGFSLPADDAPSWLQQLVQVKTPVYDSDVPAVVLRSDQSVTVSEEGKVTTTTSFAVRILTREGRVFAEAAQVYLTKAGKVKEMRAWLVRPDGKVKNYKGDEVADLILDPNDVYNEYRVKRIDASDEADAGSVFGYEAITEERPLFGQDVWRFQDRLPVLASRYTLTLPAGWRASSITFNHPKIEPKVSGSNYTWELADLPPLRPEPASPPTSSLAPRLAVNYFLADSGSSSMPGGSFEDWTQVSRWGTEIHDPLSSPDQAVTMKARELKGKSPSELDRIKSIAEFVQNLQYISIDIGVGKGNGYRPHAPDQVLAKAYGDCKDKANLMRAMLKAVNIAAYPVFIYLGDPTRVRAEWASPTQFNHVIIAIKVSDETQAPTVIQHPTLGRLLIFDPTDEHTPVGDLPDEEQGSLALIVAGEAGALMRMPTMPPESSQLQREAEVTLLADGSITASLKERSMGQAAVMERRNFKSLSNPEYKTMIERWVTRGATAAKVLKVEPRDESSEGRFGLDVDFSARAYGQLMQGRLLVFNPAIVSRRESLFLTETKRQHAVVLDSRAFTERVRVKLPDGFDIDELPDAVKLEATFGFYETKYEVKNGELIFTRTLAQRAATIPPEQYQGVRSFYEKMRAAEQAPVVLARR
jgi:hypothetical protein